MKKVFFISLFAATTMIMLTGAKPIAVTGYNIGDKAEDFRLKNTDGKMVSLKDYKNAKGYIVIFTCNHCPYAQAYEQRIIDLHKKYQPYFEVYKSLYEKLKDSFHELNKIADR